MHSRPKLFPLGYFHLNRGHLGPANFSRVRFARGAAPTPDIPVHRRSRLPRTDQAVVAVINHALDKRKAAWTEKIISLRDIGSTRIKSSRRERKIVSVLKYRSHMNYFECDLTAPSESIFRETLTPHLTTSIV